MNFGSLHKILLLFLAIVILSQSLTVQYHSHMRLKNNDMSAFRKAELQKHNELRKRHHASPLKLDDTLNVYAQRYAQKLAKTKTFEHSQGPYGENLFYSWTSRPKDYQNGKATQEWYDEIKDYDFDRSEFIDGTGHFTQLIWKGSQRVGFGFASNKDGEDYIVAQYDPPGNWDEEFRQNVLPI